jgi:hypothetical protein
MNRILGNEVYIQVLPATYYTSSSNVFQHNHPGPVATSRDIVCSLEPMSVLHERNCNSNCYYRGCYIRPSTIGITCTVRKAEEIPTGLVNTKFIQSITGELPNCEII